MVEINTQFLPQKATNDHEIVSENNGLFSFDFDLCFVVVFFLFEFRFKVLIQNSFECKMILTLSL